MEDIKHHEEVEEVEYEPGAVARFTLGAIKGAIYGGVLLGLAEGANALIKFGFDYKAGIFGAAALTLIGGLDGVMDNHSHPVSDDSDG